MIAFFHAFVKNVETKKYTASVGGVCCEGDNFIQILTYFASIAHLIEQLLEQRMKEYIAERVLEIADYLLERGSTIREVARVFCVSKSTAHKDLSERLPLLDKERYQRVSLALDGNWAERYLRGGEATRKKYTKKASL